MYSEIIEKVNAAKKELEHLNNERQALRREERNIPRNSYIRENEQLTQHIEKQEKILKANEPIAKAYQNAKVLISDIARLRELLDHEKDSNIRKQIMEEIDAKEKELQVNRKILSEDLQEELRQELLAENNKMSQQQETEVIDEINEENIDYEQELTRINTTLTEKRKSLKELQEKFEQANKEFQETYQQEQQRLDSLEWTDEPNGFDSYLEVYLEKMNSIEKKYNYNELKKTIESTKREIKQLESERRKVRRQQQDDLEEVLIAERAKELHISVESYHRIVEAVSKRSVYQKVLEKQGLGEILHKRGGRSKAERQAVESAKEEIITRLVEEQRKSETEINIKETIDLLYDTDLSVKKVREPRKTTITETERKQITDNLSKEPKKLVKDPNYRADYVPGLPPADVPLRLTAGQNPIALPAAREEKKEDSKPYKYTAADYQMTQEAFDDYIAEGFEPGTEDFNAAVILDGTGKVPQNIPSKKTYTAADYQMTQEAFDDYIAQGFEPGTEDFNAAVILDGTGKVPTQTTVKQPTLSVPTPAVVPKKTENKPVVIPLITPRTPAKVTVVPPQKTAITPVVSPRKTTTPQNITPRAVTPVVVTPKAATPVVVTPKAVTPKATTSPIKGGTYKTPDGGLISIDTTTPTITPKKPVVTPVVEPKRQPKIGLHQVISKITEGTDVKRKDGKAYKAANIKVAQSFKDELSSGNYLYNIVHFVPAVLKVPFQFLHKAAGKLRFTKSSKNRIAKLKENIETLTEEEIMVLYREYRGNRANSERYPSALNIIIEEKIQSFVMAKIEALNAQIEQDYAEIYSVISQLDAIDQRLRTEKLTSKEIVDLRNYRAKLLEGRAAQVERIRNNYIEAQNWLSGGLNGFNLDMKAVTTKLSCVGMRFAKEHDLDKELQAKQTEYEKAENRAIADGNDEMALRVFVQAETIMSENTEISNSIFGKRSTGKKYYSPLAEKLDYRDDPFVKDLFTTIAVTSAALTTVNAFKGNPAQAEIDAANQQLAEAQKLVDKINGEQGTFTQGMEAQAMQGTTNVTGQIERGVLDQTNWGLGTNAYRTADNAGHAFYNQVFNDTQTAITDISTQYASGAITQMEALEMMRDIANGTQTTLNNVSNQCLQIFTDYAKTHPQFDLTAVTEGVKYITQHPDAITQMNNAVVDISQMANGLTFTQIKAIQALPNDLLVTLIGTASVAALAGNVCDTMTANVKKGKYGNNVTDMVEEYAEQQRQLADEERQQTR